MLTLRQKLVLSFAILILLTFAVSAISIYHFVRLGRAVDLVLVNNYTSIVSAENMKEALERQDSAATFYIAGEIDRARQQFNRNVTQFRQQLEIAANNITEPGEKEIVEDLKTSSERYQQNVRKLLETKDSVSGLSHTYFNVLDPQFTHLKGRLDDLLRINQQAMVAAGERAKLQARRARIYSEAALLVALALALIFSWQFTRLVVRPIQMLARSAHDIAEGELDQRIQYRSHDEVGLLAAEFNRMSVRLRELRKSDVGRILIERRKSDAVIDSLYEPVIVTDSEGNVTKLNRAAEKVFGKDADKSLNQTVLGERLLQAVKQAVEMQRPVAEEEEGTIMPLRVGDADRSFRLRATPLRDQDGRLYGAVTVLEDVTALREVDRFKSNFIQIASRKLRGPLHSLRMALYAVNHGQAEPLQPRQKEFLYDAQETADHLDALIADLLELAEVDSGARKLEHERMRPIILTREAFNRHAPAAQAKRIKMEHKTYPDLSAVMADRRAVRSIFDNLLANAIEFTPEDGSITVGAREKENFVVFYVTDTGPGIHPDRLPRIFSRFAAERSDGTGAGLGLALVRRLVEAQGGQVSAESKVGEGSTFSFTLPLASVLSTRHAIEEG
ncbi:MAG TPA: ATP-binding protein [Candidatus Solibacter sp.]|nr:ATP-binding protein [Candidatus Solibacter sp.]